MNADRKHSVKIFEPFNVMFLVKVYDYLRIGFSSEYMSLPDEVPTQFHEIIDLANELPRSRTARHQNL